jgi:hypothetical protein
MPSVPGASFGTQAARVADLACQRIAERISARSNTREYIERRAAEEQKAMADLVRDVFGNPFRPITCSPEWRTDTILALARQAYETRNFTGMPILADALQEAGCTSAEILDHCRGPGPHVRGCWVVDLLLAKE